MSNLGLYQWMTTISKRVGGPDKFILLLLALGYGGGRTIEFGAKSIVKGLKRRNTSMETNKVFHVTSCGKTESTIELNSGDKFKILNIDGESVLIEKIGDKNNPYFVSADFLRSVSDYDD